MALRLRVVSNHARILGPEGTKIFGVHGGSIGRASDNDWICPIRNVMFRVITPPSNTATAGTG